MTAPVAEHQQPRYLALGDSYTIGEGAAAHERWPAQLVRRLHARGIALADPEIIARTGWTTDELARAMDTATLDPPYTLVTLLIGVNNQYRGGDLSKYREELAMLLDRAVRLAANFASHVIMVSTPDWGITRFALEEGRDRRRVAIEIDAYNTVAGALARDAAVRFVDITGVSRLCAGKDELFVADALHPSGIQYALWTDVIVDVAAHALQASQRSDRA